MAGRPRIVLADDHSLVVAGFRKLLEQDFDVVATVEDGRTAISSVHSLRPDVVLLDISMPLLNGLEAARRITKDAPDVKVVFVTMHADPEYVAEALRAGASGYVLKRSAASELETAIRCVLEGGTYITPLVSAGAISSARLEPRLTARQREVLQLVAEGKSTKQIANLLGISVKTVEFHKAALMEKLGLRSIAELTRYALEHGIIPRLFGNS